MTSISILGRGKMGSAIANIAELAGAHVQIVSRSATPSKDHPSATYSVLGDDLTGDLVVFAIPYGAYPSILEHYRDRLGGKVVIDISNPIDFTTYEQPEALRTSSTALELARHAHRPYEWHDGDDGPVCRRPRGGEDCAHRAFERSGASCRRRRAFAAIKTTRGDRLFADGVGIFREDTL